MPQVPREGCMADTKRFVSLPIMSTTNFCNSKDDFSRQSSAIDALVSSNMVCDESKKWSERSDAEAYFGIEKLSDRLGLVA